MAKELSPVPTTPIQLLGVTGILIEAIKLPSRNGKLMLSTTLVVVLPFSLIFLVHNLFVGPLMEESRDRYDYEEFSRGQKEIRVLMELEVAFLVAFCIVSLLGITATIHASAVTYIGKSMTLKELSSRIRAIWKKQVITWLCVMLITVTYIFLLLVFIGVFALISIADAFIAWVGLVAILAALFYVYMASVWVLTLVISVVEEDYHGMKGLVKAVKLIRGRKIQGFVLMLLLILLSSPISLSLYLITSDDYIGAMARFILGFVATVLLCITKLFTFVVYTVFYYECKKSHGEKAEMELGSGYSLIPSNLHVDVSLP